MRHVIRFWLRLALAASLALALAPAGAQGERPGRLVDPDWLQRHRAEVVLLDASMTPQHRAAHIPGAVSADLYRYGPDLPTRAAMELRIQSWGISAGSKVVVYDQGADMMATRLFFDLYYHGLPEQDLYLLDGGLARWRAAGGAVSSEPTPAPARGSYRVGALRESARVRLPEFLVASGGDGDAALVEALDPAYHYGARKFFDRAGHVPRALLMPAGDFFNADKTFKPAPEIARLLRYLGIRPGQAVLSHCGGGVAASVPWFALQFLAGHAAPVKLYLESQREWLRDDRGLPFWTYAAPQLLREAAWLDGWNAPMLRHFGAAQLSVVDLRPPAQYALGHVPFAVNVPAAEFRRLLAQPAELAALLGAGGVDLAHEVVLVSGQGLTGDAALAYLALEPLAAGRRSVLLESIDEWGLRGYELSRQPTRVGVPQSAQDQAVPPANGRAPIRTGALVGDPQSTRGEFDKVFVAAGRQAPARKPGGPVVHLPAGDLVGRDGRPRPAAELWQLMTKAGVPRHAELVVFADDPADAALSYLVLRLMGWPDVKVWLQ